jgi:hypothetical protein
MTEQIQSSISVTEVTTGEASWKPPEKRVEVVLEPLPEEAPYYPPSSPEPISAPVAVQDAACVVNVESTGLMPFDSRLISIAAADLRYPENVMHFTYQDERRVLEEFYEWFSLRQFTRIVAYNAAFDYRFIFAKAMKYGLQMPDFAKASITDVMQIMEQVKEAFVYGYNTPGKLDEWTQYFFGISGLLTYEQVLEAWDKKDLDAIASHNVRKVEQVTLLYALTLLAGGEISA